MLILTFPTLISGFPGYIYIYLSTRQTVRHLTLDGFRLYFMVTLGLYISILFQFYH